MRDGAGEVEALADGPCGGQQAVGLGQVDVSMAAQQLPVNPATAELHGG